MVEHLLWEQGAAGSNPVTRTILEANMERIEVDMEKFLHFQWAQIRNKKLLIGEHIWNQFEAAQKHLFEGGTVYLTVEDQIVAYMKNHPIDGYIINKYYVSARTGSSG